MNENEILDNLNVEDENGEIESEELNLDVVENILEDDPKTIDESFEESIDNEVDSTEDESLDIDLPEVEESENIENIDVEIESNNEEEDSEKENVEEIQEEVESEVETLENEFEPEKELTLEDNISEIDSLSELIDNEETNESEELSTDELEPDEEELQEETVLEEEVEPSLDVMLDENIITDDLNNIKIEFGIEAKGFILSVHMMEAMIQKGYIFKDMLNDKVFDAVMIFNDNLENTIMTNDIKIKVEDGKIQLIKG